MADSRRSLVLDANILIRAVMGRRVRQLIKQYSAEVELLAPDTAFLEAEEHLPQLCANLGLALDATMAVYSKVCEVVQELPAPAYSERETEARARIELDAARGFRRQAYHLQGLCQAAGSEEALSVATLPPATHIYFRKRGSRAARRARRGKKHRHPRARRPA